MSRKVLVLICFLPTAFLLTAVSWAQQTAKAPRIGYLTGPALSATVEVRDAFRQGLHDLGHIEGKNIVIEWRSWGGKDRDRQRALAAELVHLKVDVIVAVGVGDIRAAQDATSTIPIVMVRGGDAVGSRFVESLARPGGNITGLATLRPELSGKRMELLKEIIPRLSRVAVFASPNSADHKLVLKELGVAAEALGVKVQVVNILSLNDIETAFQASAKEKVEAVIFRVPTPLFYPHQTKIAGLAVKSRLPAIYENAGEVEAGGLMSYGLSVSDLYRRAATYVDKILKGTKPAELPVEQPRKFEFVINLKAAKQIGLTISPNVLAQADKVIR